MANDRANRFYLKEREREGEGEKEEERAGQRLGCVCLLRGQLRAKVNEAVKQVTAWSTFLKTTENLN